MFISRFNKFFARHGRLTFLVIAIIIVIPFVFLGMFPQSRSRGMAGGGETLGEMYGKPIEQDDFRKALAAADISVYLQFGQLMSRNPRMFAYLIQQTLRRMRALHEVRQRGLRGVTDEQVAERIRAARVLQTDGLFDRSKFTQFQRNVLQPMGISGDRFDEIIQENILVDRLETEVQANVFVSPEEVRSYYNRMKETFTVRQADFQYYDYRQEAAVEFNDEEIKAYFDEHKAELTLPDQKRVRVAEIAPDAFKDPVTPDQIKGFYEKNRDALYKEQTVEEAKPAIRKRLENEAKKTAREKAASLARQLAAELTDAHKAGLEEKPAERLSKLADDEAFTVRDSGPFTPDAPAIPQIGIYPRLRNQAYRLNEDNPFSAAVNDRGKYFVAAWLETIPGGTPEELNDAARDRVVDALRTKRAEAWYDKHVNAYREQLQG